MTSLYKQPLAALQRLVASSPTFQRVVAESGAAGALNHVFFQETNDSPDPAAPADAPNYVDAMPRAIVYLEKGTRAVRQGPGNWRFPNRLCMAFQFIVPRELRGKSADEANWFLGLAEAIVQDLVNNSGLSDSNGNPYLDASSFAITSGPMPCDRDFAPMYFWGLDYLVETP